jgi:hypothetical protein
MTDVCVAMWIGPRLGAVERACVRSILRAGHELILYCYAEPDGVPDGVTLADAAEVLPEDQIVRHHTGSVSLFSNRFRYELMRRGAGTWVDLDTYLVAPLPLQPLLLTRETDDVLSNSPLRLPSDSPMLPELLVPFEERKVPSWLPWRPRAAAYWRLWRSGRTGIAEMPWGTLGPRALTHAAKRHGAFELALPREQFNPVHWTEADWILDPQRTLDDVVTPRTAAVHLYNERIRAFKDDPAPPGSFLERLQREGR